jgi:hypothetical protein
VASQRFLIEYSESLRSTDKVTLWVVRQLLQLKNRQIFKFYEKSPIHKIDKQINLLWLCNQEEEAKIPQTSEHLSLCSRREIRDKNKTGIETKREKSETGSTTKMHIELQQPKIMSKNVFFITRNDAQIHFSPHLRFLLRCEILLWTSVNFFNNKRKSVLIEKKIFSHKKRFLILLLSKCYIKECPSSN